MAPIHQRTHIHPLTSHTHTHTHIHLCMYLHAQTKSFKFPTNCPPNIPSPSLFPGEEIHFQQHRVVCTEVFDEPAVGALYVTNFRVIFYGNLISVSWMWVCTCVCLTATCGFVMDDWSYYFCCCMHGCLIFCWWCVDVMAWVYVYVMIIEI